MENDIIKLKVRDENILEKISWQIEESIIAPKNNDWYWALGIFGLAIVIFSILLKNYLLIVIVALVALIFYFSKNKKPELMNFQLDVSGLHIDNKFYHYEGFESFWIFPARLNIENGTTTLHDREVALRHKRRLSPLLILPFHNNDESQIRKILTKHLSENEEEESLIDLLQKRFF